MSKRTLALLVLLTALTGGCTRAKPELLAPAPAATPTSPSSSGSPTPESTPTSPEATQTPAVVLCQLVAGGSIKAYQRPSLGGERFATVQPGMRMQVEARTADGWIGFDPGYAQAGNVGIFRLRWVREGGAFVLEGACEAIAVVEGPEADVCFAAATMTTVVYQQPGVTSQVLGSLEVGDYAAAVGVSGTWLSLDLASGSTSLEGFGWASGDSMTLNGPCEGLPEPSP